MKEVYFNVIATIEKLHYLFLEVLKLELDRLKIKDINNIQCLILYNIGENQLSIGEITNKAYYLGSNVTYNLKKMLDHQYLIQTQSEHDKRSSYITLSEKGLKMTKNIDTIFENHTHNIKYNGIEDQDLKQLNSLLSKLENFWSFSSIHTIK